MPISLVILVIGIQDLYTSKYKYTISLYIPPKYTLWEAETLMLSSIFFLLLNFVCCTYHGRLDVTLDQLRISYSMVAPGFMTVIDPSLVSIIRAIPMTKIFLLLGDYNPIGIHIYFIQYIRMLTQYICMSTR